MVIAPAAAGALTRPAVAARVACALVAFCLLASATYLVNDVRDRHQDRRHPRKRRRPIAAGELTPGRALHAARRLAAAGLILSIFIRPLLGAVALGYLALTFSYSLWWRQVAVIDIVAVAGGFVLRAVAGGVAAGVTLSPAFLTVTTACALFLVVGRRYAELLAGEGREVTRRTLRRYSRRFLRRVLASSAAVGWLAYAHWAFTRPLPAVGLELSVLPFAMWLGRYGAMVARGAGEAPEELVLRDRVLVALAGVWVLLVVGGVYGAG